MSLPLYKDCSALAERPDDAHAGLWYDKFCDRWQEESWTLAAGSSEAASPKLDWIQTVIGEVGEQQRIEEAANRILDLVEARGGACWAFETESRFITGLGRSHPIENGFAWHPTLGTPYLPGSSVKGMLRAWAKQNQVEESVFGPEKAGTAGSLIFFDALPLAPIKLEADVMTPHYHPWSQEKPPADWRSPTPIPFLAVAAGARFLFAATLRNSREKASLERVKTWLEEALTWAGAGAKTAVGYGRMKPASNALVDKRHEQRRRREQERLEQERLANMDPAEREIEAVLAERPGEQVDVALYYALKEERIKDPVIRIAAARRAKSEMVKGGSWQPQPAKKKQRKAHERTIYLMRVIDSE